MITDEQLERIRNNAKDLKEGYADLPILTMPTKKGLRLEVKASQMADICEELLQFRKERAERKEP